MAPSPLAAVSDAGVSEPLVRALRLRLLDREVSALRLTPVQEACLPHRDCLAGDRRSGGAPAREFRDSDSGDPFFSPKSLERHLWSGRAHWQNFREKIRNKNRIQK